MNRQTIVSIACGLAVSVLLVRALGIASAVVIGAAIGAAWPHLFRRSTPALVDASMAGAALGIPLWAALGVVLLPALHGEAPQWSAEAMRATLPALVAFVLFGAVLAASVHLVSAALDRILGPVAPAVADAPPPPRRVVILGGGFAGVSCARELERLLGADRSVQVTLVSETNALLFTPMLAEVAGSSLEATHISTPLRTSLRRTEVVRGEVSRVDLSAREVEIGPVRGQPARSLPFDHLVLGLGAVTNYFGSASVEASSIGFKSLREATRIRNRVIDAFERAEREEDLERRRSMLTFVVAGGGFAGVELAGALNDFARGMLADFPRLGPSDVRVVLVHAGDRVLPELSAALGAYALERLQERGLEFKLRYRVKEASPGVVVLDPPEQLAAELLVWTAGARPHPLLASLPVARDRRGAVVVDPTLAVPGQLGVWAGGDCAAVTDARTGKACPPTAQFALREGRQLGRNVYASLRGKPVRPFHFDSLGALCVIGHQTACAELTVPFARNRSVRFSGLLAWLLWRAIYLSKLPGLDRKVRVLTDWVIELVFPRDIVQTGDVEEASSSGPVVEVRPPVSARR